MNWWKRKRLLKLREILVTKFGRTHRKAGMREQIIKFLNYFSFYFPVKKAGISRRVADAKTSKSKEQHQTEKGKPVVTQSDIQSNLY